MLSKEKGENLGMKEFVEGVWKVLAKDESEKIGSCDLYNLLMIFIGTESVGQEVTEELINEFVQKINRNVSKEVINKLSHQSKELLECANKLNDLSSNNNFNISGESEWDYDKEQKMVSRLSTKKLPKYTFDIEALKSREFDECTYRPEVHGMPKDAYGVREYPKNFKEAVSRIKRVNEEKKRKREAEKNEFREVEVRLQRLKKMKINAPRCLTRCSTAPKKQRKTTMFYVDIGISHGR
eukprot:TRINITY_DN18811_c0_g1_i1.p1 TRINITY_DN18811_c0_g1~~TRINITY_DN18811_c0_g1_i1.p1  ORF type:complete len:239 (+),score=58.65 TRINITY_DN18811_c0_g1_i1:117-833(+)